MKINQTIKLGVTLLTLILAPTLARANTEATLVTTHGSQGKHGSNVTITLNKKQSSAGVAVGKINHTLQVTTSPRTQLSAPPG